VLPLPISALCHDVLLIQLHCLIRTIVSDTFRFTRRHELCNTMLPWYNHCAYKMCDSYRLITPQNSLLAHHCQISIESQPRSSNPTYSSQDVFPRPFTRVSTLPIFLVAYLLQSLSHPQTTGHAHPDPHCPNVISPLHLRPTLSQFLHHLLHKTPYTRARTPHLSHERAQY
jgi:hypothetical protein